MDPRIRAELMQEEVTPFHAAMLAHTKALVKMSRDVMVRKYRDWDHYDDVYRGIRQPDKKDAKAKERGEPIKMVVPLTYAQIQTAVTFTLTLFTQRPTFFELSGASIEDHRAAKIAEAVLERDFKENVWVSKLYQNLVDIYRFGIGIIKHTWVQETQVVPVTKTIQPTVIFGMALGQPRQVTTNETQTQFLGNRLYNVSPYRFFPDIRLPLSRFEEGEFCASEDEVGRTKLLEMERDGLYAGVKFVKGWSKETWDTDRRDSRLPWSGFQESTSAATMGVSASGRATTCTEVQVRIVPSEFKLGDGKPLGPEEYPVKYVVVYANDNRVIKCEPLGYAHDKFTYDVAELSPDQHHFINAGIAETIDQLQDIITWLINSRITSIRKTVDNRIIVDPEGVNMDDLYARNPIIRLKKGAARSGIDRWIKQLEITDVTGPNIKDANNLSDLIQVVTGINQNAQGQYSDGRRSAEQTKAVNAGAAGRLQVGALLVWATQLSQLGKKMLSNLRDGLDVPTFVKVMGDQTLFPRDQYAVNINDFMVGFKADKSHLAGSYDFDDLDGTLPSQKSAIANVLEQLLQSLITNPQAAAIFGYDPKALLQEILELRGVRNPEQFLVSAQLPPGGLEQQQAMMQQIIQMYQQQMQQGAGGQPPANPGMPQQQQQQQQGMPQQGMPQMPMQMPPIQPPPTYPSGGNAPFPPNNAPGSQTPGQPNLTGSLLQ